MTLPRNDDSANLTTYLLVGSKTVIDGKTLLATHPPENPVYTDVVNFTNGPVLSDTAYPRGVHLAYDGMPETLSAGDSVSMTPILLYGSNTAYTYSSTDLPAGLTFDPKTGKITDKITDSSKAVSVTVTAASSKDTAKCILEFPKAASAANPGTGASATTFTDVPDWCAEAVGWAVSEGITNGVGNNLFAPGSSCTNNEILTFLWRAAGKPAAKAASPFSVAPWYQDAIDWAYGNGMIDDAFVPGLYCGRGGAMRYIWMALGSPSGGTGSSFTDVPAGADYAAAVAWGVSNGITNGYGTEFRPGKSCSRAEIVTLLHRTYVPSARLAA